MGRDQFVKDRGIDLDAKYTVAQFIEIVKGAYGSEVIELLENKVFAKYEVSEDVAAPVWLEGGR